MFNFENLKITAFLQTPIVCDAAAYLPIDGILYAAHIRDIIGEPQILTRPNASVIPDSFEKEYPLPIKKIGVKQDWYEGNIWHYAASFAQWRDVFTQDSSFWTKRFDASESSIVDFGKRKAKIDTQRGEYKGYKIPVYVRHSRFIEWFAVGDKQQIRNLLRFCVAIGKKTSQGWGAVLRWHIDSWRWDWSSKDCRGRIMRAIPSKDGITHGIRPSYWLPKHQFPCLLPN